MRKYFFKLTESEFHNFLPEAGKTHNLGTVSGVGEIEREQKLPDPSGNFRGPPGCLPHLFGGINSLPHLCLYSPLQVTLYYSPTFFTAIIFKGVEGRKGLSSVLRRPRDSSW